tara:strand:- start:448 stop:705 length:258 start_codon:yes stop_codon:yes gene_type:complete
MLSLITGKIKTVVIIVLGLGLPILYFLGRMNGGSKIKQAVLEEEAEKAEKRADFYKKMAEYEQNIENDRPRNADDFIDRLRRDGL